MKQRSFILLGAVTMMCAPALAQIELQGDTLSDGELQAAIVTATRAGSTTPISHTNIRKKNIEVVNYGKVIVDTAGRLQTKANLMSELAKIKRVIGKEVEGAPQDTFLIIDATTGQNGVIQAKAFAEVTNLTGVVITKMDGTSKGGIILAIRDELGVPVRFIGLGEKMEDLQEFDLDKYLYGLCVEEE